MILVLLCTNCNEITSVVQVLGVYSYSMTFIREDFRGLSERKLGSLLLWDIARAMPWRARFIR